MFTLLAMNNAYVLQDIINVMGICVVLPIAIVWLINRRKTNETNRRAEILLKAIEAGSTVDLNLFQEPQKQRSIKEKLLNRLTVAWVVTLIGLSIIAFGISMYCLIDNSSEELLVIAGIGGIIMTFGIALFGVYFAGKKLLATEIEAEAKSKEQK
jgi:arginine exporter protein ArgO